MPILGQDLRYGLRMLLKRPGFALIAIITLALGIGANTAIFSVVNAVLLRPLPFKDANHLVWFRETNVKQGRAQMAVAPPTFLDWQAQQRSFDELAAYSEGAFALTGGSGPERLHSAAVSASYLPMLGVQPVVGRHFTAEEDRVGGRAVVILSHRLWQRRFGADLQIVGQSVTLEGSSYEVVGVAPPGFAAPSGDFAPQGVDLWMPLMPSIADALNVRGAHYLNVIGRLKPGRTLAQAEAEMNAIAGRIAASDKQETGMGVRLISLHQHVTGEVKSALLILLAAVGFVLLIACANIANLLLAQATTRQREVAIRLALGASRGRLVRQLLTESMILGVASGALGLFLALWGTDLLVAFSSPGLPRADEIGINSRVILFTALVSLATGVIFGLAPSLQATKADLTHMLKEGGASVTAGLRRHRLRSLLVMAEVALTFVLLAGAGLMINSFARLLRVDPGVQPEQVTVFQIALLPKYKEKQQQVAFFQELNQRLAALSDVRSVGGVINLPASRGSMTSPVIIEGKPVTEASQSKTVQHAKVYGDYFRAMGIRLRRGRLFTEQDNASSTRVMIINEALAREYFPGEDPIGKKMRSYFGPKVMREIVGIVGDVRHSGLAKEAPPQVYEPYLQDPAPYLNVTVQTGMPRSALAAVVRGAVRTIDKDQPIDRVIAMPELFSDTVAQPRFYTVLLTIFAALACALAAVGIYGVMSYSVTQRTHELGVRMALGAQAADVQRLVIGQGMKLAVIGVGIGLLAALWLTGVITHLLFGVTAHDPATFAAVALLLVAVALVACYLPARKATKVDPMVALRYE